ncbi:MAG: FG-GAP-like repeat-containing protein [Bacteroidia bacterium]
MKLNLQKLFAITMVCLAYSAGLVAQTVSFTNSNNKLATNSRSGCAVTVVDVNSDGLDDIVRMDQGHIINLELQQRDGSFYHQMITDIGGGSAWAMTMADVDKNGWKDVIADGTGGIRLVKLFNNGGNITFTNTLLAQSGFFLQNATFCDMNNDGWIDLFCCDDNDVSKLYLNDGAGNLNPSTYVNFAVNPGMFYGNDPYDSGNYGSSWIDFDNDQDLDLYVAHCRQSTSSPTDQRRINRLFVNNGNNTYTERAADYGINIGWQTWTSSFGDLDNDGDLDLLLTNHDYDNQIFVNDGTGNYTEALNTGIGNFNITPIESVMQDFDNDGYLDILISGTEWLYFHNNGNMTFTRRTGVFANNGMVSFATGDLNHDGFVDIFASYGDIYQSPSNTYDDVLYLNDRNANNFIAFTLEGTASEKGAIGSRVTIYGPWGIQVREVRAGESYGTCNSSQLHFGLGSSTQVDSAVVWFTSGTSTTLTNLAANQFVHVVESSCSISGNIISGNAIICTGQSTTLTAPAGFASYLWQDGSTTQSITVSQPGSYNVLVTDASGCSSISANRMVELNPDETPTVSINGELSFCQGASVTLTSSVASGYQWSNGSSNQSIVVTQTGNYSVSIQGVCGTFASSTIAVDVLPAPTPTATGATGPNPSALQLSATGSNLSWYDAQTGGNLVGTGNTFTTPVLNASTTYWVDQATLYPGLTDYTGIYSHSGTSTYSGSTTNAALNFTVINPCTLVSAKVYTDTPGNREIQLRDANNNVLQSLLVNIPVDTSRITVNFTMVPGTYSITTNAAVNNQNFGFNSPRLRRNSSGVSYPYTITDLISITGSNQGPGFYYYFYDWEVKGEDVACVSARVPALAEITPTGVTETTENLFSVYPNPAGEFVMIELGGKPITMVELTDLTGRLVRSLQFPKGTMNDIRLSLEGLSSGNYQLRLTSADKSVSTKKISIQ